MDYAEIYRHHAADYDALVRAEDARGELAAALLTLVPEAGTVVDVGTGTGRISRLVAERAGRIIGIENAPAMLEVARRHRAAAAHPGWELLDGDARELPVGDVVADLVVAGWVFGHFRSWMADGWRAEVDRALTEMRRVAKPGAVLAVIETLGTNCATPRAHPALDEYFAHLEAHHDMTRHVVRTDYRFADAASAGHLIGLFFGAEMAAAIAGSAEVPECTGLWLGRA